MAIDTYMKHDIANWLRAATIARYGSAMPKEGEFMEALDTIGADAGLERMRTGTGQTVWIGTENMIRALEDGK